VTVRLGPCDFHFRDAVCGFFELPTEHARRLLPPELQPVEPHHGQSVLAVLSFDFSGSELGAYGEVVLALLVAPRLEPGRPMPRSAMYPVLVATTTERSRDFAIEQYRLPHLMREIDVAFDRRDGRVTVRASEGTRPILELTVTEQPDAPWEPVEHWYQSFSVDDVGAFVSDVELRGDLMEHEEEQGRLVIHPHEFTAALVGADVSPTPFREQWMRGGTETVHPLRQVASPALR
jgi:hypothetical protein